jgi:hypothetical protein
MAAALTAVALLTTPAPAVTDDVPDAQLLLDLDLLSQAEPHEGDLMRRLSVVERLPLLEMLRPLDARPAAPAKRRAPADAGRR